MYEDHTQNYNPKIHEEYLMHVWDPEPRHYPLSTSTSTQSTSIFHPIQVITHTHHSHTSL